MFEQAQVGTIHVGERAALAELARRVPDNPFRPPHPAETLAVGFIDPWAEEDEAPPVAVEMPGGGFVAWLRIDRRKVPAGRHETLVKHHAARLSVERGRPLSVDELHALGRELHEQLCATLVPESQVIPLLVDPVGGRLVVGVAAKDRREQAVAFLGHCLGNSVHWLPHFMGRPITPHLTDWVRRGAAAEGLALGDQAVLQGNDERRGSLRTRKLDTDADSLRQAIEEGLWVVELGLETAALRFRVDALGMLRGIAVTPAGQADLEAQIPQDLAYPVERRMRVLWQADALLAALDVLLASLPPSPASAVDAVAA